MERVWREMGAGGGGVLPPLWGEWSKGTCQSIQIIWFIIIKVVVGEIKKHQK